MIRSMFRWLAVLLVLAAIAGGAVFVIAGRGAPPTLSIEKPERVVGQTGTLEVTAGAPGAVFTNLTITLEQNGREMPLFSLDDPQSAKVTQEDDQLRITRPLRPAEHSRAPQGAARIVVSATRPSLFNLRTLSASASKDIQITLEPPRLSVVSTHHYVNHGGSELVLYRVTPPDVQSGVRVGDLEYPGYPAGRRRRSRAADGLLRAAATSRTSRRRSPSSRATRSGTRRRPRSSTRCFRSRSAGAASCSTIASCSASCPRFCSTRRN